MKKHKRIWVEWLDDEEPQISLTVGEAIFNLKRNGFSHSFQDAIELGVVGEYALVEKDLTK